MPCCAGRGESKAKHREVEATFDIYEIQPKASMLQSLVMTLLLRNLKRLKQRLKKELKHRVGKPEESDDQADKLENGPRKGRGNSNEERKVDEASLIPTGWSGKFTRGRNSHIFNPTGWISKLSRGYWTLACSFPLAGSSNDDIDSFTRQNKTRIN